MMKSVCLFLIFIEVISKDPACDYNKIDRLRKKITTDEFEKHQH